MKLLFLTLSIALLFLSTSVQAYPLNGFDETNITRLEGYFFGLRTPSGKRNSVPGALLSMREVRLNLENIPFQIPPVDQEFSRQLKEALGSNQAYFSVSLLDITDPTRPLYASVNGDRPFTPGSVGKLMVAVAVLQALADIYPNDIAERKRVLRDSQVVADSFIETDTHVVPFWIRDEGRIDYRPVQIGDTANLWTYLDWMLSASSNAAGSMVMRELLLLKHFGKEYPVPAETATSYLKKTTPQELARTLRAALMAPMTRYGLNAQNLFQSSFFTAGGRKAVPISGSNATTSEFVKLLTLIEEGKLIDSFSSLELKRLIYLTQPRIRYASSQILDSAAVYYKSGSLFRCKPEANFSCSQFHGNLVNLMNSVGIVEYPAENPKYVYIVALSSNVLRRDSQETHIELAATIQRLIERRHQG